MIEIQNDDKGRVMEKRSELKDNPLELNDGKTVNVYIQDNLTKRRANLAYRARQLKKDKNIFDTWVSFCKIIVKDNYNHISVINDTHDLLKYENATARAWYEILGWLFDYSNIHIRLLLPSIYIMYLIKLLLKVIFHKRYHLSNVNQE